MSVWINVDRPTKRASLHRAGGCEYELGKQATAKKGIGELKADGGWLHFASEQDALKHYEDRMAGPAQAAGQKLWTFIRCPKCF